MVKSVIKVFNTKRSKAVEAFLLTHCKLVIKNIQKQFQAIFGNF